MQIDIATLKLVLCLINILNLCILFIQYLSNKEYKGILHWIAGFGFIALSQIITLEFVFPPHNFTPLFSDLSIVFGFSIVLVGINYFISAKYNNTFHLISATFALVFIAILYLNDLLLLEKMFLSIIKSIICFQIVATLWCAKISTIKRTTNFIGILFFTYASVFLLQSISILINGINTNLNSPIFIVIYLFSIIVGIISTFGFTFLVNQRLIGEREKVENNAQLVQYAVNNTLDAVYWIKKDGTFLELNKSAHNILGYTYKELMNLSVPEIDLEYDKEIWPKHWDELKEKKSMTFHSQHVTKDGKIIPTEVNANYIFFNGQEINCAFVRDISERKKAEQNLIATKNHLKAVLDSEPECIKLLSREMILLDMNPAGLEMIGADNLEQVLGKSVLGVVKNEYQDAFKKQTENVFNGKSGVIEFEIIGLKGEHKWLETHSVPMKDNSGKIISLLAITRDITERKKSEQKMNELMVDTIDKNNRLQNFAHIVSHNIRSHAANFSGLLEIIKDAKNEDEKKLYFEYLNSSSVKLSETIDNLNEIITIQSNNSLPIEQLELKKEIDKTIKSLNFSILEHHVLIENNISYNVVINSIPAYFDSIILNLITNAIKYRATNRTPIIKISSKVEKDYTILFIEDNGLGIDLEKNGGKLFGMYKTFNGNSDAKGIGLFITKNQIEAMKGKIEVSSKLDVGTTFIIYFKN
jgi:PAS domain S-box-containing protein